MVGGDNRDGTTSGWNIGRNRELWRLALKEAALLAGSTGDRKRRMLEGGALVTIGGTGTMPPLLPTLPCGESLLKAASAASVPSGSE